MESFCLDYFVMNLRWSIKAAFKNPRNFKFFQGFVHGYYQDNIPPTFKKQSLFILILNFLDHVLEFWDTKEGAF